MRKTFKFIGLLNLKVTFKTSGANDAILLLFNNPVNYFQMWGMELKRYVNLQLNYMCVWKTCQNDSLCLPERKAMYSNMSSKNKVM